MTKALLAVLLAGGYAIPAAHAQAVTASANVINLEKQDVGTVTFQSTPSGMLRVIVELTDLPPGTLGFHVHETGECSTEDAFESAGGHIAGDAPHGIESEGGPHPGDFPNIHVAENGVVKVEFFTDRLSISDGDFPLMDEDGSAVMVHSGPDDYTSQPGGDAGDRIACGVIRQ